MKVRVWVQTNKVGSRCERIMELDDFEEGDGYSEEEQEEVINDMALHELFLMYEWGWEIVGREE